jgi:acyl-CoA hydrolase
MEPRLLRPGELPSVFPDGGGLTLVSSSPAESDLLAAEVAAGGAALGAIDCSGIFVSGLNKSTWQAGPRSRVTSFFLTPELRGELARTRFLPMCYEDILRFYRRERPVAALFMCSPPDAHGNCSFGAEVSFPAALWREIPVRIAHINPLMPRTPGDPGIPMREITAFYEGEQPLRTLPGGEPDAVSKVIAGHAASLVPDGATLQTGLGKLPDAVLAALSSHQRLRLHTGLVGDGVLALLGSGALAPGQSALVGVAIGSQPLYDALDHEHFQFRPSTVTHDPDILGAIDKLVTINSAMEVDLFGQAFAESSSRGFQSGPGGASDYARGARRSNGGLRIIALPSSTKTTSRIVAPGKGHGPVSLSRFDVDLVVTEHGVADLRFRTYQERAAALIAVAAPEHREALEIGWRETARTLQEG